MSGPEIPHQIFCLLLLSGLRSQEISVLDQEIEHVHQRLAAVFLALELHSIEAAVFPERDTAVEEQIAIDRFIHAAAGIEETDMPVQRLRAVSYTHLDVYKRQV